MSTPNIPKARTQCIPAIESSGAWKFDHYQHAIRLYWFRSTTGREHPAYGKLIPFTLPELRHAYFNGW